MEIDSSAVMNAVMPFIRNGLLLIFGAGLCIGVAYFLFVILRRRTWLVEVWEEKADGALYLVDRDILVERKFNKGKQTAYILKRAKVETLPPPTDCAFKLGRKEYAYYLRVLDDYVPLRGNMMFPDSHNQTYVDSMDDNQKSPFIKRLKESIRGIRGMSYIDVQNKYIYAPIKKELVGKITLKTMDYDVNMMRINALDNREKIYADTKGWIEKYGQYLVIGGIIVLVIVALYLSYDYSKGVIDIAMSASKEVSVPLNTLADKLSNLA